MADISRKAWDKYIEVLRKLNDAAADQFKEYLRTHEIETRIQRDAAIEYAYALATKYGEASAALSALMYDSIAELSGAVVPAAQVAQTATAGEVAKAIYGASTFSQNDDYISGIVGRMVKQAGADTTLQNARRDGAEFAWISVGDTCAFCELLSANGWQHASADTIKGNHAEHIHANCDCAYAVRFNNSTQVGGYDPDRYRDMYYDAPLLEGQKENAKNRINAMRRQAYAKNKDEINANKRMNYAERQERLNSSEAEEIEAN